MALYDSGKNLVISGTTTVLTQRFKSPLMYEFAKDVAIKGGVNYGENKNINFLDIAVQPHGPSDTDATSSVPANYLFIGIENTSSLLSELSGTVLPTKKIKYNFPVIHGREYTSASLSYTEKIESDIALPVNFISGNLTDGYHSTVSQEFMSGVIITNIHNDTYGPHKETPTQGPFTNQWVGGRQSRHIAINQGNDTYTTRPEAWKIVFGTGSFTGSTYEAALGFIGADYPYPEGNPAEPSFPVLVHKRATYYREETAKRPLNVRNIIFNTSSSNLGNYSNAYEVVSTFGRTSNNRLLRQAIIEGTNTASTELSGVLRTLSGSVVGRTDYTLPERSGSDSVIGSRFSAPGGPRYSSRGFLNNYAEELSPYNAMSFRNREVMGNSHGNGLPYAAYSVSGAFGTGSVAMFGKHAERFGYVSGSSTVASLHKENRNTSYHIKSEQFIEKYDNAYVTNQIPRKDSGYAWIRNSLPSGSTATASLWEHYRHANNNEFKISNTITSSVLGYRTGSVSGAVESYTVAQDFVGLNTIIVESTSSTTDINTIGTSSIDYITSSYITTVPTSSNLFNAMLIHRNGGYGYPSFKQLSQRRNDKVAQYLRKNNIIQNLDVTGNIISYSEPVVESSNYPIVIDVYADEIEVTTGSDVYEIVASYDNFYTMFSNTNLNRSLGLLDKSQQNDQIRDYIVRGDTLDEAGSLDGFAYEPIKVTYKKRVFPISSNSLRKRTSFVHEYWRDSESDRRINNYTFTNMNLLVASAWPLDGRVNFQTTYALYSDAAVSSSTEGLLQNLYTQRTGSTYSTYGLPLYFYKQSLANSSSVRAPSGLSASILPIPTGNLNTGTLFFNSTKWQVYDDLGYRPYNDSYDDWFISGTTRSDYFPRNYSVLPEYRISSKIPSLIQNSFSITSLDENYLDIEGASIYATTSSNDLVGASYIESIIDNEGEYNSPKITLTLKLNTVEKFLPYNGFYPVERTLDIVDAFSSSYIDYVSIVTSSTGVPLEITKTNSKFNQFYRTMIQPLFAPGILYNTIKSGIAVDYPIITSSLEVSESNYKLTGGPPKNYQISNNTFDLRLPFETILQPEKYFEGVSVVDMNPHEYVRLNATASLNGVGDNNYKLMINNFLAETVNLFLKDSVPSSIRSAPIGSVRAENGKRYQAIVKIYKSTTNQKFKLANEQGKEFRNYSRPQYSDSTKESITMFSNPLGFGPPCSSGTGSVGVTTTFETVGTKDSANGYNAPFTPPYYDGESWAIIEFAPTDTKTYTLDEIIGSSSVKYIRYEFDSTVYYGTSSNGGGFEGGKTGPQGYENMNNNAMQVSASLNLFNIVDYNELTPSFNPQGRITSMTADKSRSKKMWEISSKFETPILNFSPTATGRSVTQPTSSGNDWGLSNAGMWLQYGEIPVGDQGIYMQIIDVPRSYKKYGTYGASGSITYDNWYYNAENGIDIQDIESLVDLVGFSTEPVKMGQLADSRTIKEGIVAIPYTISDTNERQFIKLNKAGIDKLLGRSSTTDKDYSGTFVEEQIKKLQDYVLPLHLDYINNSQIEPIAMYIFEVEKTLTQSDLSNIWQNVLPQNLNKVEKNEYTITHTINTNEMISSFNIRPGETIKFMCFKVKQRGITKYELSNYDDEQAAGIGSIDNKKMFKQAIKKQKLNPIAKEIDKKLDKGDIGYNWPYDYFSLVELAQIDAIVEFTEFNPNPSSSTGSTGNAPLGSDTGTNAGNGRGTTSG